MDRFIQKLDFDFLTNRIEGATLTDQEVETLLKEIKITKLQSRDEQEVVGYYEVLELIYEHYGEIASQKIRAGQQHRGIDAERIDHWLLFF